VINAYVCLQSFAGCLLLKGRPNCWKNHWVTYGHSHLRLATSIRSYGLWVVDHPTVTQNHLAGKCFHRRLREAGRLLCTDTCYQFCLPRDTTLSTVMGQMLYVSGDLVDVWCVPSATRVPCVRRSHGKVFGIRIFFLLYVSKVLYLAVH